MKNDQKMEIVTGIRIDDEHRNIEMIRSRNKFINKILNRQHEKTKDIEELST